MKLIDRKGINSNDIIDTLIAAQQKYPGSQNSLDALCKRFNIDNSKRVKHNALIDCQLLKEVYINLIDQKEPKLDLKNTENYNKKISDNSIQQNKNLRKIIKPNQKELELHKSYLESYLRKNFFN